MMDMQASLYKRVKQIFKDNGQPITIAADDSCVVEPCRYFGSGRVERFPSVIQAVSRFCPLFKDERMYDLYP